MNIVLSTVQNCFETLTQKIWGGAQKSVVFQRTPKRARLIVENTVSIETLMLVCRPILVSV